MAGMGQHIGAKFDELGWILDAVDSPRLKICLDTQHAFAAGYDLTNPQGIQAMLAELDSGPGSANVAAVHANDSKRVCVPEWTGTTTLVMASSEKKALPPSWPILLSPKCHSCWKFRVSRAKAQIGRTWIF